MVPACHAKVVQKHLSFRKLFQWTVKRLVSRKVTEMCYAHSFSFHCISVAKSAGELRLLGMEIKEHFLMLPAQIGNLSSHSKYFSSSALIVESHLTHLRCTTLFECRRQRQKRAGEQGVLFDWFTGFVSVAEPIITVRTSGSCLPGPHPLW